MSNNSNNRSNSSNSDNSSNFEGKMLTQADDYVEAARKAHKLALKVLGDAKKHREQVHKKVKLSKKLRKLVNRSNINNISTVRKAYNNAVRAGVPEMYGKVFRRQQSPVGKAREILSAYNNMMGVRKSLKNPSKMSRMGRSAARTLGLRSERNNRIANHKRLESAYELCERYGICNEEMNKVFNEVADMEDYRTNAERARNEQTRELVRNMPTNAMIRRHTATMPARQRLQPTRLRSNVFNRRGNRLRAHSIANTLNAQRMYNNTVSPRQNIGMRRGSLPQIKRRTKKAPTRRASN